MNIRAIILALPLICAACGGFRLGYVQPQTGKTANDQQIDIIICKDQAATAANTPGRQVGAFLAGMTIIGGPIAIQAERSKQREVFTDCMIARGYAVLPPHDGE